MKYNLWIIALAKSSSTPFLERSIIIKVGFIVRESAKPTILKGSTAKSVNVNSIRFGKYPSLKREATAYIPGIPHDISSQGFKCLSPPRWSLVNIIIFPLEDKYLMKRLKDKSPVSDDAKNAPSTNWVFDVWSTSVIFIPLTFKSTNFSSIIN